MKHLLCPRHALSHLPPCPQIFFLNLLSLFFFLTSFVPKCSVEPPLPRPKLQGGIFQTQLKLMVTIFIKLLDTLAFIYNKYRPQKVSNLKAF